MFGSASPMRRALKCNVGELITGLAFVDSPHWHGRCLGGKADDGEPARG